MYSNAFKVKWESYCSIYHVSSGISWWKVSKTVHICHQS